MLSFVFNYRHCDELVDVREVPTRRHDGLLFKEPNIVHHKAKQNPLYRAILAWNSLPVHIRNIEQKGTYKRMLLQEIQDPYKTVE